MNEACEPSDQGAILPVYRWRTPDENFADINAWSRRYAAQRQASVIFAILIV